MKTKKETFKQSKSAQQFYKAIKAYAANKFNVLPAHVAVVGNSKFNPDSVSMPTDIFMNDVIAFARYDVTGKTVGQYACKAADAMIAFQKSVAEKSTVTTHGVNDVDQLVRINWKYLEPFALELK